MASTVPGGRYLNADGVLVNAFGIPIVEGEEFTPPPEPVIEKPKPAAKAVKARKAPGVKAKK